MMDAVVIIIMLGVFAFGALTALVVVLAVGSRVLGVVVEWRENGHRLTRGTFALVTSWAVFLFGVLAVFATSAWLGFGGLEMTGPPVLVVLVVLLGLGFLAAHIRERLS